MGDFLTSPKKEKTTSLGENSIVIEYILFIN